ncbi:MAG: tRNA 2-thiouridine(34) synthase MnmA [Bacteroidaceae bacterium]|nr:tRNA 2-thiouridine(34) synthase MnmA [Bacteroidaceae bacterium]
MFAEKSVLVGMSGGIDSTAVCCMLLEQGFRVEGLTFVTCDAGLKAVEAAAALAERLGIPHHVADVRARFKETVIGPFVDSYLAGYTPNPCVNCNPLVKFALLEEWADRLGCAHIATGHYVKVESGEWKVESGEWKVESGKSKEGECKYYIVTGDDDRKDQSYFLWRLTQRQLSRVIFPLGGMEKPQVVEYLKERGFGNVASGGESMEVCFIPGDYRSFLRENVPDIDSRFGGGAFVDCNGRVLGKHAGFPFYTVGQRKGLGIALGYPAYVLKINAAKNTVMLGTEEQLLVHHMLVEEPQWVDDVPQNLKVRVRYRSRPVACDAPGAVGDGRWLVRLHEPVPAIAPGQSAVFYVGNAVVGGAFIADQRGINQWIKNPSDE